MREPNVTISHGKRRLGVQVGGTAIRYATSVEIVQPSREVTTGDWVNVERCGDPVVRIEIPLRYVSFLESGKS